LLHLRFIIIPRRRRRPELVIEFFLAVLVIVFNI
jgi:hypothetical protein